MSAPFEPGVAVVLHNAHNAYGEGCGDLSCDACRGFEFPTSFTGRAIRTAAREMLAITSLEQFVRFAWHLVVPAESLTWNWHISLLCEELEMVSQGKTRHLIISIPPGHMKSLIVAVFWPAWEWLRDPAWSVLALSADDDNVIRDAVRSRDIIRSPEYGTLVRRAEQQAGRDPAKPWRLTDDQDAKHLYKNTRSGFRQSLSIGASVTGKRARGIIVDDPYDAKKVVLGTPSQVRDRMAEVVTTYKQTLRTRLNNQRTGFRVVIMQRLHEEDLAGVLIKDGDARVVALDTEFDPDWPLNHPKDPRKRKGELLFARNFPKKILRELRADLGARQYAAQFRQRPTPDDGQLFKRDDLGNRYKGRPQDLRFDEVGLSVDCTFKDAESSDFVVIQVWGRRGALYYLLDQVRDQMGLRSTIRSILDVCARWPSASFVLIEDKANGPGVIDVIAGKVPNVVPYNPETSKYGRAQVAAIAFESQSVFLPSADVCPWIADYVEELVKFGAGGAYDDQVDATSQILIRWTRGGMLTAAQRVEAEFGGLAG